MLADTRGRSASIPLKQAASTHAPFAHVVTMIAGSARFRPPQGHAGERIGRTSRGALRGRLDVCLRTAGQRLKLVGTTSAGRRHLSGGADNLYYLAACYRTAISLRRGEITYERMRSRLCRPPSRLVEGMAPRSELARQAVQL